ncbi:twin-arginine translocase TatA/TatE family subunit [Arthrobacter sp. KR32]|uniref:Sec-independent protein translocase protein TatA n=1 Tax=Arthrobacter bussei TaxID=2594179 RepID=A0A7X1TND9_9MICC|nr:Sec-independent protein translocase subunit TatA [Arthrobacter bussei]MPY10465.1 twin-arginine translocase TatA/TatE family subunit [Arthrobacter bussei]
MKLEGWHIVIIIVLAIVLFGAPKLPGLARSVGQSLRIFKSEVKQMKDENNTGGAGTDPVEGRVVNPAPQTYTPTYQAPAAATHAQQPGQHPAQQAGQSHQQPGQQHVPAPHQGEGFVEGRSQAGPSQQSGTSHTSQ